MRGDEVGIDAALLEQGVLDDLTEERNGGLDAADHIFAQGAFRDAKHLFPVSGVRYEQRARRVVVGGELVACADIGIKAHAGAAGRHIARNEAGIGGEVVLRVFAVDAHLHGPVRRTLTFFAVAQFRAKGHGDLLFHKVNAVAAFGDAVFNLQTGINFNKVRRTVRRNEEFDRGKGMVAHGAHKAAGIILEPVAQVLGHARPGRRRDFNEFLVVALHGAIAFVKGEHVAVHVGNDLNLNVAHIGKELFHKQARIAKRSLSHGGSLEKGVFQISLVMNGKNTATAAAPFCLEHDGQPDLVDKLAGGRNIHGSFRAGHNRNAQFASHFSSLNLVAQEVHGLGCRADKGDARLFAALRKARVLGSKPPAGVNADYATLFGFVDNAVNIQIRAGVCPEQHQFLRR